MNPWPEILHDIKRELERVSLVVEGRSIVPSTVRVLLPRAGFGRFSPVLGLVTREIGEALETWAEAKPYVWATDAGLFLELVLEDRPDPKVIVETPDPIRAAAEPRSGPPISP